MSGELITCLRKLAAGLEGNETVSLYVPGPSFQLDNYHLSVFMRVEHGRYRETCQIDLTLADAYKSGAERYVMGHFEQARANVRCMAAADVRHRPTGGRPVSGVWDDPYG